VQEPAPMGAMEPERIAPDAAPNPANARRPDASPDATGTIARGPEAQGNAQEREPNVPVDQSAGHGGPDPATVPPVGPPAPPPTPSAPPAGAPPPALNGQGARAAMVATFAAAMAQAAAAGDLAAVQVAHEAITRLLAG